jgi:hypothetical protein
MIDFSLNHDVLELQLELDDELKWVHICKFLNIDFPELLTDFPHANSDENREWVDIST